MVSSRAMPVADSGRCNRHWLLISQVYPPDPAAVGQYLHEVASELVSRGDRVSVVTAACGYHDPRVRYPRRETLDGVQVRRLPLSSFGKASMAARLAGGAFFLGQALQQALTVGQVDAVLVSTSPPLAPPLGALVARLLHAKLLLWVMDINPDQAVVSLGYSKRSPQVLLLEQAIRRALREAAAVVTLDRFMASRLAVKLRAGGNPTQRRDAGREGVHVIPPWPLGGLAAGPALKENPFRIEHDLVGRRVLMYSGNISATHPLTTLLEAFAQCPDRRELELVFIGEGTGAARVDAFISQYPHLPIRRLPYQPLEALGHSLAAADVHLVSMGDEQVGLVHPCKVYGIMQVARPFVFLGPMKSHVGDILREGRVGFHLAHGDVPGGVQLLGELATLPAAVLDEMGARGQDVVSRKFSRATLLADVCRLFEAPLRGSGK